MVLLLRDLVLLVPTKQRSRRSFHARARSGQMFREAECAIVFKTTLLPLHCIASGKTLSWFADCMATQRKCMPQTGIEQLQRVAEP